MITLKKLTLHPQEQLFSPVENSVERLELVPQWSQLSYDKLSKALDWQEEHIRMFGKVIRVPRLVVWYGEKGYSYSGKQHQPKAIPEMIRQEMHYGAKSNLRNLVLYLFNHLFLTLEEICLVL